MTAEAAKRRLWPEFHQFVAIQTVVVGLAPCKGAEPAVAVVAAAAFGVVAPGAMTAAAVAASRPVAAVAAVEIAPVVVSDTTSCRDADLVAAFVAAAALADEDEPAPEAAVVQASMPVAAAAEGSVVPCRSAACVLVPEDVSLGPDQKSEQKVQTSSAAQQE